MLGWKGENMKLLHFILGIALIFFGLDKVTAEIPEHLGWLLIIAGLFFMFSVFSSARSRNSHSGGDSFGDGGSSWGDSGGGDCGGGGD